MALIQSDAAFLNNAGDDARFGGARADGANAAAAAFGDAINFLAHFSSSKKSIATTIHRRAAGMRGLSVKSNGVTFDAKSSEHRSEREIKVEQNGTLFDVKFEIGSGVL